MGDPGTFEGAQRLIFANTAGTDGEILVATPLTLDPASRTMELEGANAIAFALMMGGTAATSVEIDVQIKFEDAEATWKTLCINTITPTVVEIRPSSSTEGTLKIFAPPSGTEVAIPPIGVVGEKLRVRMKRTGGDATTKATFKGIRVRV